LKSVGPAAENAHRANSVRTRGTNSRGAPAERIGLAGAATVNMYTVFQKTGTLFVFAIPVLVVITF